MITVQLKLRPYKAQEGIFLEWLHILTGMYNWGIRKIKLNAKDKIYFNKRNFQNLLAGTSKKLGIHSLTIQGILHQSWDAWSRCFKKIAKEPKLKGMRNKLRSIPFPCPLRIVKNNRIYVPGIGEIRFFKQDIPNGKIKCGSIIKKASGWYMYIVIDASYEPKNKLKENNLKVGIDTGFNYLAVLSNGTKYDNPRELRLGKNRLAQAQKGKDKKLTARLYERQTNRRKDRNHKISLEIVQNHQEIYITNDDLRSQAKKFGKSVTEAGIGQLRKFISYKGSACGRKVTLVDSHRTTMTCSDCGALTGPKGWSGLKVRDWECSACGAQHDRDVNAAQVVLKTGLGCSLMPNMESDSCLA